MTKEATTPRKLVKRQSKPIPGWAVQLTRLARTYGSSSGTGSLRALATKTGVHQSLLSRYFNGRRVPHPLHLRLIFDAYTLPNGKLLGWEQIGPVLTDLGQTDKPPYNALIHTWDATNASPAERLTSWRRTSWPTP